MSPLRILYFKFYELPHQFPSKLLLDTLKDYRQEILPSDTKDHMYIAIMSLIQSNAFQMQWNWIVIYTIAAEVDSKYTFIDRLRTLKYPNDDLLAKFVKSTEIIGHYVEDIGFETYVKFAKVNIKHKISKIYK